MNDGHAGLFNFLEAGRVAIGVGDEDVDFLNAGYLEVGGDTNLAVIGHHDDQAVRVLDHELVDLGLAEIAGGNADLGINAGAAHNTDIGENTVMSAQVGVAGSTKVGQWCMFGGQVGLAGHIVIGNKVFLGAQSGVPGNIKDNQQLIGTPPMKQRPYFKSQAVFRRLPELYKQINDLQKQVEKLQKQIKP